jgi:hypothetical protein
MLKSLPSLLLLSFFSTALAAQQPAADSPQQELTSAKEDTNKVWSMIGLAGQYHWTYPDSAILYAQQALQLKAHGGDLKVETKEEESSTFIIRI